MGGMPPRRVEESLEAQLVEMQPPLLSKEVLEEGGEKAVAAILAAFEQNSGFIDLAKSQGKTSPSDGAAKAAELLLRRSAGSIQRLDLDAPPEEVQSMLQRQLDLMTAL